MTALYTDKITFQSAAATTAAASFPASNMLLEALGRYWSATGNGNETVDLTVAAARQIYALFLHDVNFAATGTIQKSADGIAFTNVAAMTTYAGRHGRRRGLIVINDPNTKVIRIPIAAGASTDGKPWRIGSAPAFASKATLPFGPDYTYKVRTRRPRISTELPNGVSSVASTGLNIDTISMSFTRRDVESFDTLVQKATAGTCLFDLELPNYPEGMWPVRFLEADMDEDFQRPTVSALQVTLKEVVASA